MENAPHLPENSRSPARAQIRRLAPSIAERIAAGEIIERPASVVKELVENSLDAGSTEIIVTLEDGGKGLIEVLDNGHGMPPEDLELCIERHATSKLSTLEDLERITTLGFRGEALPSIGAVSDLNIVSRAKNTHTTYQLSLAEISGRMIQNPKPEKITFGHFIDSPHGTRIRAQGLFSQIPARLKFLKSQGAEVSQVREWIERLALAYPHVGFKLLSDERTILNLRPQDERGRVQAILSDGEDYPIITVNNEQDGFRDLGFQVRIHWLQGLSSANSKRIIQVVNLRAVRDRILQQATLVPFRQALLPGQFPAIALLIDINPAAIDVNVHPTKTEIRFLDNRKIFHTIETMVRSMIARAGAPAFVPTSANSWKPSPAQPSGGYSANEAEPNYGGTQGIPVPDSSGYSAYNGSSSQGGGSYSARNAASSGGYPSALWNASEQPLPSGENSIENLLGRHATTGTLFPEASASTLNANANPFQYARLVGAVFNTYLMYEKQDQLILLDQHAAHERIRYEKLKKRILGSAQAADETTLPSQALLIPEVVRFSTDTAGPLEEKLKWLGRIGFETELFGEDTLLFRSVPVEWGTRQLKIRLKNLVDRLLTIDASIDLKVETSQAAVLLDEALFEVLASEACHSAIRAGDHLEIEEMKELVEQLFACEHPWNCPHGRPTVVKVPQGKLEEWFQRKI
jgi:DNA mismatch repair protein MutL